MPRSHSFSPPRILDIQGKSFPPEGSGYPFDIPAVRAIEASRLEFHPRVTFFVGENGSGKSTLVEALAVALRVNPEGGDRNLRFDTRSSHSVLGHHLRVARSGGIRDAFFLRAESLFNVGTALENLDALERYGGTSLHEQSHGESFMAVAEHRLGKGGVYLMDEPEAALSPLRQLRFLTLMHRWVSRASAQLVIATHSPILTAYPDAWIYELSPDGIRRVTHDEAELVRLYRDFLKAPSSFLHRLMEDVE